MALQANALTSLVALKTWLKYQAPANPHADDPLLETIINAASDRIEGFCDRFLAQRAGLVEVRSGHGRREFLLNQWPVTAVANVRIDSARAFGTETVIPATDYVIIKDREGRGIGLERVEGGAWDRGRHNLRVVYDAGYAAIPADLELACKFFAGFYKRRLEDQDLGLQVRNKGDENITIVNEMPPLVREILQRYKRVEFYDDEPIPSS